MCTSTPTKDLPQARWRYRRFFEARGTTEFMHHPWQVQPGSTVTIDATGHASVESGEASSMYIYLDAYIL